MAKKGSLGYQAEQLRRKGQRRIERLQAVIKAEDTSERVRNWASRQVKEIQSAMQGTRQYSKSGKRYKSKGTKYIKGQIDRLEAAVKEVAPRYTVAGDSFEVTQREMNRASVGAPSVYTKSEVKVFYRATQKLWQEEGVGEHDRNEVILRKVNARRKKNNLSPLSLDDIVDYVLDANKRLQKMQDIEPDIELDEEQKEFYDAASAIDNDDGDKGSPNVSQAVIAAIQDALSEMSTLPDFAEV